MKKTSDIGLTPMNKEEQMSSVFGLSMS